jgi:hypothetical protein
MGITIKINNFAIAIASEAKLSRKLHCGSLGCFAALAMTVVMLLRYSKACGGQTATGSNAG